MLFSGVCVSIAMLMHAFVIFNNLSLLADQLREKMMAIYDPGATTGKLKRYEINITDEGFFRYKKIYTNGKQEYYSFNIVRLTDIAYLGNTGRGALILRTTGDDIIVQTHNDPRGNIDSMATMISIPAKLVEAEDMQLISDNLMEIKSMLRKGN